MNAGPGDGFRAEPCPADVVAVRALVAATGFFSPEEIAVAAELVEEGLAEGPASGYEFRFADEPGRLAGYSCFGRIPLTAASYDLYWIVVAPSTQRRGVGRRLLAATEAAVAALGFPALDIVQPGLLLGGERAGSRPLESVARALMPLANPLLGGGLKAWRGIDVAVLARAMLGLARSGRRGVHRYTYEALAKVAAKAGAAAPAAAPR